MMIPFQYISLTSHHIEAGYDQPLTANPKT